MPSHADDLPESHASAGVDPETLDLPASADDLPGDPALAQAVFEIEAHVAQGGWDQPARLFALVATSRIVAEQPELAAQMGLTDPSADGSLTPVEQDELPPGPELEESLTGIGWPPEVTGCAAVVERLVLPPEVDEEIPDDPAAAAEFAANHPLRQEVRIVAGATRAGSTYAALRMRAHDDDQSVVGGTDLVPELQLLVHATLDDEPIADHGADHGAAQ